jgi:alcohol dehydrogenase class IV
MDLRLPEPLLSDLEAGGLHCIVFDQVPENPTIASVEAGVHRYRSAKCDSLIAFGGGSVMDCAKGIGARVGNPWLSLRWMEGLFRVLLPPPPLACIPTTAGSGSEATVAAVFTDTGRRRKFAIADLKLIPKFTVIDPGLMSDLPPSITAAGGLDALTHAVESYIGRNETVAIGVTAKLSQR